MNDSAVWSFLRFIALLLAALLVVDFVITNAAYDGRSTWWMPPAAMACLFVGFWPRVQLWLK